MGCATGPREIKSLETTGPTGVMEDSPPVKVTGAATGGQLKKIKAKKLAEKKDKTVEKFDKRDNVARIINEYSKDNFDMENYTELHQTLGNLQNTTGEIRTGKLRKEVINGKRVTAHLPKNHFMTGATGGNYLLDAKTGATGASGATGATGSGKASTGATGSKKAATMLP